MFINFIAAFIALLILALYRGWKLALICLVSLPVTMVALGIVALVTHSPPSPKPPPNKILSSSPRNWLRKSLMRMDQLVRSPKKCCRQYGRWSPSEGRRKKAADTKKSSCLHATTTSGGLCSVAPALDFFGSSFTGATPSRFGTGLGWS